MQWKFALALVCVGALATAADLAVPAKAQAPRRSQDTTDTPSPATPYRQNLPATVKWFNPANGSGFVSFSDGSPDAFLHVSNLRQAGYEDLNAGAALVVDLGQSKKGIVVTWVHSVDESTVRKKIEGSVSSYNAEKAHWMIKPTGGGNEMPLPKVLVTRTGVDSLEVGAKVSIETTIGETPRVTKFLGLASSSRR